jgi:acetyl esterase
VLLYPDADSRSGFNTPSWREHDGCVLDRVATERWHAMYLPDNIDRTHRHVSPALAPAQSLSGLPPAFIVTAEFDPLRDEGELYAKRLREASVPVALVRYPGMIHGFLQMGAMLDAAGHVMDRIAAVLAGF